MLDIDARSCYFIAELGHNHQGDLSKALEMVDAAAEAGASAVKLQKRNNRSIFTSKMYNAPYNSENSFGRTYGEHREALELTEREYEVIRDHARLRHVDFMATAFDQDSANILAGLGVNAIKIASADITNTPLLEHVASLGLPLVVSTGGATMDDVRHAHDIVIRQAPQVALLQCTSIYPAEPKDLDLRVISTYINSFPEAVVGYSGHDLGADGAIGAYVLGARVIEKHFTLDHKDKGSDHHFSMEPDEFRQMVGRISAIAEMLGSDTKRLHRDELRALAKMGKHMVASQDLPAGHEVKPEDIQIRTAGCGMPPNRVASLVGRRLAAAVQKDDPFPDVETEGSYVE
ncbi:N-acetylneuraminate synthase family protein [Cutibacterium avidum]|uniref:N-acetylneuraminate synthase family protein n=1 Tax=Cutibacterium avidum TaxID=33010 RepID=UPI0020935450|nr:N-acetylneuraminate synthase family protein [Cutibacterium avidum]MCO6679221.1 N-acetylneuraminate synthase family protein [Cutibacterium avidum]